MLIDTYQLRIESSPSDPWDESVYAMAEFNVNMGHLLPHVNAVLGPGLFDRDRPSLRINQPGGATIFYAYAVGISKCKDEHDAQARVAALIETVNAIADRQESIEPSYRSRGQIKELDAFRLLPRTNCGQCGLRTCLAFAAAFARGRVEAEQCPALLHPSRRPQRLALSRMAQPVAATT